MLNNIEIHQFRNISFTKIDTGKINLFYGENGSGKTSLLEAIYYLSLGRSFRSRHLERIIQKDQPFFSLFSKISDTPVGIRRNLSGNFQIRINGQDIHSTAELAIYLPVQLLNYESFHLLTSGAKERRHFVDWGAFHVEHDGFFTGWKNLRRVIKQRNSALKMKSVDQVKAWDVELAVLSQAVNKIREDYLKEWQVVLNDLIERSELDFNVQIHFQQGWAQDVPLAQIIRQSLERDLILGYTQHGAHRADIKITVDKKPAHEILSRGQQKLFICLMKIAQAKLLKNTKNKNSIFLIDDLPSELDEKSRQFICNLLIEEGFQLFVTGIERGALTKLFRLLGEEKLFHVEQGKIFRTSV